MCNVTCGGGYTMRTRFCSENLHGGSNCTGDDEQYDDCNAHECPGKCSRQVIVYLQLVCTLFMIAINRLFELNAFAEDKCGANDYDLV